MFHDTRWQYRPACRDEKAGTTPRIADDATPPGIPLDVFWALVDPIDRPDPRDA